MKHTSLEKRRDVKIKTFKTNHDIVFMKNNLISSQQNIYLLMQIRKWLISCATIRLRSISLLCGILRQDEYYRYQE